MRSSFIASLCGSFRFTALILIVAAGCDSGRRPATMPDAAVDMRTSGGPDAALPGACAGCPGRCCQNKCAELGTDPRNCGACGAMCQPGTQCMGGKCLCLDENG